MRAAWWCVWLTACGGWGLGEPVAPTPPPADIPPPTPSPDPDPPAAVPDQAAEDVFRVAVGSCYDQHRPDGTWQSVLSLRPDLYVAAGDNVYADVEIVDGVMRFLADPQRVRDAYATLGADPGWQKLADAVPIIAVWDDHDYGLNDAGADLPFADESQQAFLDFFEVPGDDPRRQRPGVYAASTTQVDGLTIQVLTLDTRRFRSRLVKERGRPRGTGPYAPDPDPQKTLLGEDQWRWLEQRLEEPADLRLIVSGIQVLPVGHRFERWDELPHERRRLIDLISRTRAQGVVLLSGDRHFGSLYTLPSRAQAGPEGGPYPLWELTSSSLNKSFGGLPDERAPLRIGPQVAVENIGLVDVDPQARTVRLALVDKQGAVQTEQTIALDTLRTHAP